MAKMLRQESQKKNQPPKPPTDGTLSSSTKLFLGHYVVSLGVFIYGIR